MGYCDPFRLQLSYTRLEIQFIESTFVIRESTRMAKQKKVAKPAPALLREDGSLYAVLTAAVAALLEQEGRNPEGGFVIRSARTVHGPETARLTPRDATLHAVITAAIARVLEAEGINPESGFAIRSVTPIQDSI